MSRTAQRAIAIVAGVAILGGGAFFLLSNRDGDAGADPGRGGPIEKSPASTVCPLSGNADVDQSLIQRPAIAVKIENTTEAFPLSGLEDAEIVYEELVEGGLTRFLAMYHCTDTDKAGPVRSARIVDPAIMSPITRVLAAAGGNDHVIKALDEAGIVLIDETGAGEAMRREDREGIAVEHTLYADTDALREVSAEKFTDLPTGELFAFGEMPGGKTANTITIEFSPATTITYEWGGENWQRSHNGTPFVSDTGDQITVDNVLIEEHDIVNSKTIVDSAGNPSTEISDVTGTGRAVLFRDGKAFSGVWKRESADDPVIFETKDGQPFVLKPGNTWVALVPSPDGEIKGSFDFAK